MSGAVFVGSFPAADFLIRPVLPEVAFLGRSNVGKSSLINALVGRRSLAHTSKTPGKTRACNVYDVQHRYYLVDLPGYGFANTSRDERRGFARLLRDYVANRETLAGVAWLLDLRHDPSADDLAMSALLAQRGVPLLAILTKADKVRRGQRQARAASMLRLVGLPEDQSLMTSVSTREGIPELRRSIAALAAAWARGQAAPETGP